MAEWLEPSTQQWRVVFLWDYRVGGSILAFSTCSNSLIIGAYLSLWRTAPGDAVLERSIENRCKNILKAPRRNMRTWALNKYYHFVPHSLLSVTGILQFRFVRYFTWIPWIFRSVSVSVAGNQMALGSALLCVLRHTIMTSPTCALTQLFVPDNHWQGCPRRHLKSNTCVRRNVKHTHFHLFRARLIK